MVWILLGWKSEHEHEVGRVTSRHQGSLTLRCLVDGASVLLDLLEVSGLARHEQDHWALDEQDLGVRLVQRAHFWVPLASLKEHSHDIDSIFWSFYVILIINNLEVIVKKINSNSVLSGIVLLGSCQESLSEEESGNPEHLWQSVLDPLGEPGKSLQEILVVPSECLK